LNVLVVTKPTNYELHAAFLQGRVPDWELAELHTAHQEHYRALDSLRQELSAHGISFQEISRDADWPDLQRFDAVITVGGDGTLLSASHRFDAAGNLIGLKSSRSSVGHLCVADGTQVVAMVRALRGERIQWATTQRLKARVRQGGVNGSTQFTVPVLNDLLFVNQNPAATTRYRLTIGDESEEQKSSGIWVSTATGSTAAIAAAGGKSLPMEDRRFQYRIREPFQTAVKSLRFLGGTFEPEMTQFIISNRSDDALIALDGQHGMLSLQLGDEVEVLRATPVQIAKAFL